MHRGSQPSDAVDEVFLTMNAKTAHPTFGPVRSEPPKQHENDNNDQDEADNADATVTVAVTVAAEAATEATKQKDDEQDDEYQSHDLYSC
jgi:hypothetical protein